ncbi:RagB/SusD family nutrient uptake outer membrane protein [Chryseolinea sp. H1M3-3]|uniref:RagB/SusD family nutrient uptake outer membrane protein n=1 Tax=Chryseolinea sp. H1M3-3 TaxID=3034144 RepID=UPI0023ECEF18|nr:RagB/SusD family nutrient uptake outer membrane protein [Chryseolinea sp. H1M3-3]
MTNNIKNVFSIAFALALVCTSCELEEEVYSSIYTENFFQTASDAEAAIAAAYGPLVGLYSGPAAVMVPDFSADQVYPRVAVSRNTLTLFTYDVNYIAQRAAGRLYESPQQIWISCFDGIEKSNWVIQRAEAATMDDGRKQQIIGEAYFLRAFYHWMATKNFGEIPIKIQASLTEAEAFVEKSSIDEVYAQIFRDLDEAIARLPVHSATLVKGRPSKETAHALYAKAALYNQKWALSLANAQAVIANPYLKLLDDVRDVFNVTREDAARTENIFSYEAESSTTVSGSTTFYGHQLTGLYGPPNNAGRDYGRPTYGSTFAYYSFFTSFDPDDERRLLLDTTYVNNGGAIVPQKNLTPITTQGVLVKKYQDPLAVSGNSINIPIFRLADVYLIAGEAEAHLNGATPLAYEYVNMVRSRAGLEPLQDGLNSDSFIEAVLQERSWELFAEGDRWYDLTRTDKFLTVIPSAVNNVYPQRTPQARNKYFPIPQDELNANPVLTQNDPWK